MSVLALYRQTLRQANYLPHPYLQAFVKGRARDYFRRHRHAPEASKYIKYARHELRRLERINRGEEKPFMHLLRHAFGRTGRLRRELMLPHFANNDPTLLQREPIIPGVDKSRPPSYPRTLLALVSSTISRTSDKGIVPQDISRPKSLPERADPSSEEALLLGPLSLRRVKNIHHRFFTEQTKKVLPPLEVSSSFSEEEEELKKNGIHIPRTGLEIFKPVAMLTRLATQHGTSDSLRLANRSHRFLRRRYRQLLGEIPSLTVSPPSTTVVGDGIATKAKKKQKQIPSRIESIPNPETPLAMVDVGYASNLALHAPSHAAPRLREATATELEWIREISSQTDDKGKA